MGEDHHRDDPALHHRQAMPGRVPPAFLPSRGDGAGRQAHDTVECPFLGKGVHRLQRLADQRAVVGAALYADVCEPPRGQGGR